MCRPPPQHAAYRKTGCGKYYVNLRRHITLNNVTLIGLTFSTLYLLHQWNLAKGWTGVQRSHGLGSLQLSPGGDGYDDAEDEDTFSEEDCDEMDDCAPPPTPPGADAMEARPRSKRWRQAATRQEQRNARTENLPPLPSVEGLPLYITDGKRRLPDSEMFVNQGNYEKYMKQFEQFNQQFLHVKSFPQADMVLQRYNFSTCAVVGSSGSLMNASFGRAIDSHETVLRINQAPTNNKFHKHVGSKTTFRLINTRWANKYGDQKFLEEGLLSVTRAKPRAYDNMARYLTMARSDVRMLYLSSRVVSSARRVMVGYRVQLDEVGRGPYHGGSTPSSGYLAAFLMMQLCDKLTLYGFGLDDDSGNHQEYHYFQLFTEGVRKNQMNPTHSFDVERELMRGLEAAGYLQVCAYQPGPHKHIHNKKCGIKDSTSKLVQVPSVNFAEFDTAGYAVLKNSRDEERIRPKTMRLPAPTARDMFESQAVGPMASAGAENSLETNLLQAIRMPDTPPNKLEYAQPVLESHAMGSDPQTKSGSAGSVQRINEVQDSRDTKYEDVVINKVRAASLRKLEPSAQPEWSN
eukprot:CAMPEP_0114283928 /NCGR_PEP_ID=MMETSP0059-20121206/4374_1 /TAXON_ID=36894 /ORGANISM="Pyramimonas parkeae, Strain CCMP726" /LENGTH=573 /DNA_ID=CAMNT_0001404711 /DNA_START=46 /DNA_END=1767 /DNA_ORIENTATION=-